MKQNSPQIPLFLLALGIVLALVLAVTGAGRQALKTAPDSAAAAAGNSGNATAAGGDDAAVSELVLQRCGTCHSINILAQHPQSAQGWQNTVALMQQMGAQVAPEEAPVLVNYLTAHYGPAQ